MKQKPVKEKFKDQTPCWPNHTKNRNVVCDTILMRKRKQKFGKVWTNSIVIFFPHFFDKFYNSYNWSGIVIFEEWEGGGLVGERLSGRRNFQTFTQPNCAPLAYSRLYYKLLTLT